MGKESRLSVKKAEYEDKMFSTNNYGEVLVLEYNSAKDVVVKFLRTGNVENYPLNQILIGNLKDYMQPTVLGVGVVGKRLSHEERQHKAFKNWVRILTRCYNETNIDKRPSYKDCCVSDYFLNYLNFKEWYVKQQNWNTEGFVLDKDLLSHKENKIYSPETCCFIPYEINSLLTTTKASRGELPIGVRVRKGENGYCADIGMNSKNYSLGNFSTPELAFKAYKVAREEYLKSKAEKYKELLDVRAYKTLLNFKVEITD